MSKSFKLILLVSILFSVLYLSSCSNSDNKAGGENTEIYACPMHPEVTGKKGDKCPTCGMNLELVKDK